MVFIYLNNNKEWIDLRTELLLGFTKNGEVVFGNIDTDRGYFSASFDTSYPIELTEESVLEDALSFMRKQSQ